MEMQVRYSLYCLLCGYESELFYDELYCPRCRVPLVVRYSMSREEYLNVLSLAKTRRELGVWSFYPLLPTSKAGITLGEGWTPQLVFERLARVLGLRSLIVKNESTNPTGTFVDRGAAVDVWHAYLKGFKRIAVAALGDFAVSISSYGARLGMEVLALVPRDVTRGTLYKMLLSGARVDIVDDYGKALDRARKIATMHNFYFSHTSSTMVIEGYRTIVFEMLTKLINGIDYIVLPIGEGVLATAIYKGIQELSEKMTFDIPKLVLVRLSTSGLGRPKEWSELGDVELFRDVVVEVPTALSMAMQAVERGHGMLTTVDERTVLRVAHTVARNEGLVLDPIGVVSLAGLEKLIDEGIIDRGSRVLAIVSGSPSKDPFTLYRVMECDSEILKKLRKIEEEQPRLSAIDVEILRIVAEERTIHSYAIWKKLNDRGYSLALSTVIYHIKKLEEKGLIRIVGRHDRRIIYALTEEGMSILKKFSE